MEQQQVNTDLFSDSLQIDEKAKQHLAGITSWCIIIVVVAVIGYILSIADLLTKKTATSFKSENFSFGLQTNQGPVSVMIGLIIGLTLNYFLFSFATQTQKSIATLDQDRLNNAFGNLKTYFIFYSVLMIIVCLFVLLAVAAILS